MSGEAFIKVGNETLNAKVHHDFERGAIWIEIRAGDKGFLSQDYPVKSFCKKLGLEIKGIETK